MKRFRPHNRFAEDFEPGRSGDEAAVAYSEETIVAFSLALGAREVRGWSLPEETLTDVVPAVSRGRVERVRDRILCGEDPLGELFCSLRTPAERRKHGAT